MTHTHKDKEAKSYNFSILDDHAPHFIEAKISNSQSLKSVMEGPAYIH